MGYRDGDFARLLAAFAHKKHDRVPNMEMGVDPGALSALMGWSPEGVMRSDLMSPEKQLEIKKRTCEDAIICHSHYYLADTGSITGWEDYERCRDTAFDPLEHRNLAKSCVDATRGTNLGVAVMTAGPFLTTYWSMGPIPIQSFMYMLYDDIKLVKALMDLQTQRTIEIIQSMEGLGVGYVEIADDLCDNSGLMIKEDMLEEIWFENIQRIVTAIRGYLRVPVQFHCCGKLDRVIPYFLKLGIDSLSPIQTNVNNIYQIKRDFGDRLALMGNLSIDGVLAFGTPEQVAAETRERIDKVGYNGGYIVSSSHSIVDAIPTENYLAMIETAVNYGRYDR